MPISVKATIRNREALAVFVIGTASLVSLLMHSSFWMHIALMTAFWAGLATAYNICAGLAGQFSFGHHAFVGVGAYTVTLLSLNLGVKPWLGVLAAGIAAALLAAIIGYPSFRLKGIFFAMATFALAQVVYVVAVVWVDLTNGGTGIIIPYKPSLENVIFFGKEEYLLIMLGFMGLSLVVSRVLVNSRVGYILRAVGQDEDAAASLGVNSLGPKLLAFCVSAFLTGLGGALMYRYILFVQPSVVLGADYSFNLIVICLIGGLGTVWGPSVGAMFMIPLSELMRSYFGSTWANAYLLIYGVVLVVVVVYMPRGLIAGADSVLRNVPKLLARPNNGLSN